MNAIFHASNVVFLFARLFSIKTVKMDVSKNVSQL